MATGRPHQLASGDAMDEGILSDNILVLLWSFLGRLEDSCSGVASSRKATQSVRR